MNSELWISLLFLLCLLTVIYSGLWIVFRAAGLRGWYVLIPVWVFYCWARVVRIKRPMHCCLMTSIFIYGMSYVMPWYSRIFGEPTSLDSAPPILVSHTEFFIFGLFLLSVLFGFYQYIRLCWRLAEAFSFGAWLAILMILMPPLSLALGLVIIIFSRRPFQALEISK
jgi:hypothetical protein